MAMESAFTQQPAQLANPVPSETAQPDNPFKAIMDAAPQGQIDLGGQQAPAEPNPFAAVMGQDPVAMGGEMGMQDAMPMETPMESNVNSSNLGQQFSEAWTRIRNAFTVTPKESEGVLKSSGKFDDVKIDKEGTLMVKRKGDKKYSKFDRDEFEIIGDILDGSRMFAEMGIEAAAKIPATVATTLASGGLAAPIASGASAALALNIGDVIGQTVMGIERDPSRSAAKENALALGFGAGFSIFGSTISRKMAQNRAAREALESGRAKIASKIDDAATMVRDTIDTGIQLETGSGVLKVTPGQASGSEELMTFERELSAKPEYRNFVETQKQVLRDAYEGMAEGVGRAMGTTGKDFNITFKDMGKYYGKQIESFRNLAKSELKGMPQQADNTLNSVKEVMGNVGAGPERAMQMQEIFPALTDSQSKVVLNAYEKVQKKMANGQISVDDIDKIYISLRTQIDNTYGKGAGQAVADALIPLKNAVRDDYTKMIGNVIPENQRGAYEGFMQKYSDFKTGEGELRNLLKQSDLSKKALVSTLFEGKNSLSLAKSAKAILDDQDPEFFKGLANDYFVHLKNASIDPDAAGQVNWKAMARKFGANKREGLGKEMQDLLLDSAGMKRKEFDALMNLGQMVQKTKLNNKVQLPKEKLGMIKTLVNLVATRGAARTSAGAQVAEGMSFADGTSMMQYLQDGGWEAVMDQFPAWKRSNPNMISRMSKAVNSWQPSAIALKRTKEAAQTRARQEAIESN